ncbi:Protein ssh4 [Basidiobolus ranarum]|uniref:Protein ssh4 n=1 Tax=Basidiobolus ranarum TaxID=34480 RepID=A0ABR2WUW0_9FUNG
MTITFSPIGLSQEIRRKFLEMMYQLHKNDRFGISKQPTEVDNTPTTVMVILLTISLSVVVLYFTFRAICLAYNDDTLYLVYDAIERFDDGEERSIRAKYPSDWNEAEQQSYQLSRAFESQYPPGSQNTEITQEQQSMMTERGVAAWELEASEDANSVVEDRTEVIFHGGEYCVQTNLPLPFRETVCYFEVKIFDKPTDTIVAIGLGTKPFPSWRLPGRNRHSVGYHSNGSRYCNDPFDGRPFGPEIHEGDVVGCGYRVQSGTIFFTHNGVKINPLVSGAHYNFFPTIGANGPCALHVNFGQMGFVFIEGNIKKWGFGPMEGSLQPPPAYDCIRESTLLASEGNIPEERLSLLQLPMVQEDTDWPTEHTASLEGESTSEETMSSRIREWHVPIYFPWEVTLPPPYTLVDNPV